MNLLTKLDAAITYGKMGAKLFPVYEIVDGQCSCVKGASCSAPGKHPRTPHGYKDAGSEDARIRQFWQSYPNANVSIVTGSGFATVLDIDPRNGGLESLAKLESLIGSLPSTVTAQSGGGGKHLYFKYCAKRLSQTLKGFPGIDVKNDKGSIIAPPSNHISGGLYRWEPGHSLGEIELAELPEKLVDLLTDKTDTTGTRDEKYNEGSRHTSLFSAGCKLIRSKLSFSGILAALRAENKERCMPPLDDAEVQSIATSIYQYSQEDGWSETIPLPEPTAAPVLPESLIPAALREWVKDSCERKQIPFEFLTIPAVVIASSLLGRRTSIKPKKNDDWEEVANLWGAIVAPPGAMKTPCFKEALRPLEKMQEEEFNSYKTRQQSFQATKITIESKIEHLKKKIKAGKANDKTSSEIFDLLADLDSKQPTLVRYILNDATIEKMAEICKENPDGVLYFRDELAGLLNTYEKKGHESDRKFFLEAWSGNSSFTSDRINRGTNHTPNICLSVLGGIQPEVLGEIFSKSIHSGGAEDGFLSRLQLIVEPALPRSFALINRPHNPDLTKKLEATYRYLAKVNSVLRNTIDSNTTVQLIFSSEAQEEFNRWLVSLELRIRRRQAPSAAFEAHLSKFRSLVPKLALVFHWLEVAHKENKSIEDLHQIELEPLELAFKWAKFLEEHAKKIYEPANNPELLAATELLKKIQNNQIYDAMAVRDIYRKGWANLTDKGRVRQGLDLLAMNNWVKISTIRTAGIGGAPSDVVLINPVVTGGDK